MMLQNHLSKEKDDVSSSSYDSDECLTDLLGISIDGTLNWQEEEETASTTGISSDHKKKKKNQTQNHGRVNLDVLQKQRDEQRSQQHDLDVKHAASLALRLGNHSSNQFLDVRFRNAHGPMQEGSWSRPKVAICDMSRMQEQNVDEDSTQRIKEEDRGKGLVATDFIPKGSVIFTEKAALATQVPILHNSSSSDDDDDETQSATKIAIQACQSCFRSLEPLSKLSADLPCPELWPVLPLEWQEHHHDTTTMKYKYRSDRYGRIQCLECQALFCGKHCYEKEQQEILNGCCTFSKLQLLPLVESSQGKTTTTTSTSIDKHNNFGLDQPPVVLAAKIFCHATAEYRRKNKRPNENEKEPNNNNNKRILLEDHFLWALCGDASDLDALELGVAHQRRTTTAEDIPTDDSLSSPATSYTRTLDPLYQHLKTTLLRLTEEEQETLSLPFLHMLASKTARNGFGIRTQSPFKPYYSGLLRKFGRDSPAHKSHMEQVAMAVSGTRSKQLERGMDRLIDEQVAPWITGIFVLTAHMNHSCEPNAMVVSQEFADAHVDLVAKRDILAGEEIVISYIQGVGQKSTNQRRRELKAKYLFICGCSKCKYSK